MLTNEKRELPGQPQDPGDQVGRGVVVEGQHQVHPGVQEPGGEGVRVSAARGQHHQDGGSCPPDRGAESELKIY